MNKKFITRNISLFNNGDGVEEKRKEILEYFNTTFTHFELLFETFIDDSVFYEQPEPLRHKLIFYFGHTATFFINKLILGKYIENRINPEFESIFAIGVDEMSWDDLNDKNYAWPSVDDTRKYRDQVRELVSDLIKNIKFTLPITWDSPMWAVLMGIEHERIHIETSSVLHRQLDQRFVKEHKEFNICNEYSTTKFPKNELLDVNGAKVTLGKKLDSDFYGWDNEYGFYEEYIEDFKASKYLVSNGEFKEFVDEGGYENKAYWSDEGNNWREYTKAKHPTFWIKDDGGFRYKTLSSIIDLPLDWPVDVNFLEAEAFCRYKSEKSGLDISLPSEAQYNRLREFCDIANEPEKGSANINFEFFSSSCAVDRFKHKDFYDVVGNVWQWTTTPIDGFEGFKIHPLYDDFSVPTFDTRHNIIKGGSWASSGNEVLGDSRYAFRRHFFQHAGFRYVQSSQKQNLEIDDVIEFKVKDIDFNIDIERILKDVKQTKKALHIGCEDSKKITDELSKAFDEVIGIDFTARNIQVAESINDKENVKFWQGDACNLKPHFKDFDLIIATNKKEQLYNYKKFLNDINDRLSSEGVLELKLR